jgi:hypothetical protein
MTEGKIGMPTKVHRKTDVRRRVAVSIHLMSQSFYLIAREQRAPESCDMTTSLDIAGCIRSPTMPLRVRGVRVCSCSSRYFSGSPMSSVAQTPLPACNLASDTLQINELDQ